MTIGHVLYRIILNPSRRTFQLSTRITCLFTKNGWWTCMINTLSLFGRYWLASRSWNLESNRTCCWSRRPKVTAIMNSRVREGVVSSRWKFARITPLAKSFPLRSVGSDLRPVAVAGILAIKMVNIINRFFTNTASDVDCSELVSLTHTSLNLDCNKSHNIALIIMLVDFSEAFDLIDLSVLSQKFHKYNFPISAAIFGLSFLEGRSQFMWIGEMSSMIVWQTGCPRGFTVGNYGNPYDFELLVHNLPYDCIQIYCCTSTDLTNPALQQSAGLPI